MTAHGRGRQLLIAGVGNIFLGDDGFGCEVAHRLERESWPQGVHVEDYGIRGVHLAYQLLEGYDTLILIDAARRGEAPGTVFVLEPDFDDSERIERGESGFLLDAHGLDPEMVLAILHDLGGKVERVVIVGCEPASVEEGIGLSDPVAAAVEAAVSAVRDLVTRELDGASVEAHESIEEEGT